jgi:hypothetical protein
LPSPDHSSESSAAACPRHQQYARPAKGGRESISLTYGSGVFSTSFRGASACYNFDTRFKGGANERSPCGNDNRGRRRAAPH